MTLFVLAGDLKDRGFRGEKRKIHEKEGYLKSDTHITTPL